MGQLGVETRARLELDEDPALFEGNQYLFFEMASNKEDDQVYV